MKTILRLTLVLVFLNFSNLISQCSYTISAGTNKTITCTSPTVTLAGSTNTTGLTYTWSPGGSAPNSLTTSVTSPGIYTLSSTNPVGGCITTSTVSVISNTVLPDVSAGSNQFRTCTVTTVTLTGSSSTSGVTFSWTPGGNTTAIRTATAIGTYTLKVTDPSNGCSASSTVAVSNNTVLPNVSAGSNQVRTCSVSTVTLSGSSSTSGATFSWTPGGITTATRTATAAGTYTLKVTDPSNGCSASSTVAVTNNTVLPNISAGTNKTLTCTSPSAVLTGSSSTSGVTYSWSPGGLTTNTISVSTAGTYTLRITNPANDCLSSATVAVTNNTINPNISAGTNKTITCTTPTAILTGSSSTSGVTYSWTPGGITTTTLSTTTAGIYTLTITNPANGCISTATVSVTNNTVIPDVSAGSDKTITCTAPSAVLSGTSTTSGITYSWSPGGVTTATRTATAAGTYSLKVTITANGCYSISTVSVTSLIDLPNVSAGSNQVRTCSITTVTLTGSSSTSGVTYSWSPGGNTTAVRTATAAGTYTLRVTNPANSCVSSATVSVTNNTVLPNVSAGSTQSLTCISSTATLTGSSSTSGATFSWTPGGITTATRTATALGTYTLKVTDPANSCTKTATVAVVSNTVNPNVSSGTTQTITCSTPTAVLTGSSSTSGVTFSWSPGSITTSTAGVTSTGTYTLKVTNPLNGCSSSSTVNVVSNINLPNLSFVNLSGPATPTSGLVAYWPFNGDAQDYSGNSNHGAVSNASLSIDRFGNASKAYAFNGADSRIDVPNSSTVDMANGQDYTIAFWMKSNTGNVDATPISKNEYGAWSGYMFLANNTNGGYCNSTGQSSFYVAASGGEDACADNPICSDFTNWYFITGQYNATTNQVFMYVNSVLQGDIGSAAGPTSNTKKLTFGAYNDATNLGFFNGYLDDIRFYNRLLSQHEINMLYQEANSANSNQVLTCLNPSAVLTGSSSTSGATYSWSPGSITTNSLSVSTIGDYTLKVTNPVNGCSTQSIVSVSSSTLQLNVNAGTNQLYTSTNVQLGGFPVVSNGTGPYTYSWTPNTGFASGSTNTQTNPYVAPSSSTLYQLTVTDALACTGSSQVFITNYANSISYGILAKDITGGFVNSVSNKVYFKFEEEYTGINFKYKIYDITTSSASSANTPISEISCTDLNAITTALGSNKYAIDFSYCGSFVPNNIYLLEVINSKNEKFYLKFKA